MDGLLDGAADRDIEGDKEGLLEGNEEGMLVGIDGLLVG